MQANSSSRPKTVFGWIPQAPICVYCVREDEFACKYSSPTKEMGCFSTLDQQNLLPKAAAFVGFVCADAFKVGRREALQGGAGINDLE